MTRPSFPIVNHPLNNIKIPSFMNTFLATVYWYRADRRLSSDGKLFAHNRRWNVEFVFCLSSNRKKPVIAWPFRIAQKRISHWTNKLRSHLNMNIFSHEFLYIWIEKEKLEKEKETNFRNVTDRQPMSRIVFDLLCFHMMEIVFKYCGLFPACSSCRSWALARTCVSISHSAPMDGRRFC